MSFWDIPFWDLLAGVVVFLDLLILLALPWLMWKLQSLK